MGNYKTFFSKNFWYSYTFEIYGRIFGGKATESTRVFIRNINYAFISSLITGIALYALNILAGRYLSVAHYGQYQLVVSLSFFLIIPLGMGLTTASIHHLSKTEQKKEVVSSALVVALVSGVIFSAVALLASDSISKVFAIDNTLLPIAIVYTFFFAMYSIARALLQGLFQFRRLAILESVYAFCALFAFAVFRFLWNDDSYRSPVFSFSFGYGVYFLLVAIFIRGFFSWSEVRLSAIMPLLRYGSVTLVASVSGFLLGNVDKFIINGQMGIESVGIYSAYFYAASVFMNFFLQTFITVFFPSMSKTPDYQKISVNKKINTLFVFGSLPILLCSMLVILFSLYLFNGSFPLDYTLVFLFSVFVMLQFFVTIKQWLLASFTRNGIQLSTYSTIIASFFNVLLVYGGTHWYGLSGAVIGLVLSLVIFSLINRHFMTVAVRLAV